MSKNKLTFDWDKYNTTKNALKHGILPFEAEDAFKDRNAIISDDIQHSDKEERYILLGKTRKHKVLLIAFTIRERRIRPISIRQASKKEVNTYHEKETGSS